MGLADLERRLERLVEGVFAKAFRSGLQPVELLRRLTREMDADRSHGVRGVFAPNHFTFALSPVIGPIAELDGQNVRLVRTSLTDPGGDARRVETGDGPLWIVEAVPFEPAAG